MNDGSGFEGMSLLELFKLEAESHCAALSDGLLALEKSPGDRSIVEPLMRAAHSIKGAARIVGLDVIVSLAHVMEECFLAAKDGRESLSAGRVDQLLKAIDVLSEVRSLSEPELAGWIESQSSRIAAIVADLKAQPPTAPEASVATASIPAVVEPPTTPVPQTTSIPSPVAQAVPNRENVRVASSVLNRMLFLAGESTVESSRLQALRSLMVGLKSRERALENAVQALQESRSSKNTPESADRSDVLPERAQSSDDPLDSVASAAAKLQNALSEQSLRFDEAFRRLEEITGALYAEVLRSRMRPFSEGLTAYPRMVRDIARQLNKSVELRILGEAVEVDRETLQKLESPLTHIIRNSLDHGIELPADRVAAGKPPTASIVLSARHQSGALLVEVRDDGRGIDPEAVRRKVVERRMVDSETARNLSKAELLEFLFLPGFSTKEGVTELSGRGVGLDVVQSSVREVSGAVTLESEWGKGTRLSIRLPVTRSVLRACLVRVAGELYAVPLARLHRIVLASSGDIQPVQGRLQCTIEGQSIGLIHASEILGGERSPEEKDTRPVLLIGIQENRCGLIVDEVCGEEDLVVRPIDARLGTVPHVAATAIRSDGIPVFVLDLDDLMRSLEQSLHSGQMLGSASLPRAAARKGRLRILVVDDSITVREVERQLLLRRGYDVEVAVDGREGFSALRAGRFDLMVTDVDMPRMTGIELIRAVRREPKFADLPIIIVSYKDREEDRMLGLEAGASAYLTKSSFHDDSLIRMVEDLIGAPG